MNKPITNGIDVSECNAYKDRHCKNETSIMFTKYNLCSKFPNCYFKQLKRLQQQIEAYQLSENEAKEIIAELEHKNKRLQQELDIKEKMLDKFMIGSGETLKKLQEENEELKEFKKEISKTIVLPNIEEEATNKYKQALKEIRGYCDEQNLKADYTACYITNRIDEVLNDRD